MRWRVESRSVVTPARAVSKKKCSEALGATLRYADLDNDVAANLLFIKSPRPGTQHMPHGSFRSRRQVQRQNTGRRHCREAMSCRSQQHSQLQFIML
ncbi:hypothetical protein ACLKA6_007988 [Drosophila palustris]